MKSKATALLGLVTLMCLSVFSATATGAGGNRVLITDPAVLESMGFPRNATNVYRAVNAGSKVTSEADVAGDFGTVLQRTGIAPKSFIGRQNTAAVPWQYSGGAEGCCINLSRTGPEEFADAPLNLPHGALLTFIRFWANDTNAVDDMRFFLFESCHPALGPGATSITSLVAPGDLQTTGATGNQSDSVGNLAATIDAQNCVYTLRVNFEATTGLTLQKMRAQWTRQISPAPAVASFTDVPPGAQFFQEVEALAASGITAGCGDGTIFCPEQPVTRRQMAAFLSRALGL